MSVEIVLSVPKELALAILPIPSAMLSVVGSSTIIYMAYNDKRKRKCSPYTRLLVAMSVCDIILSSNLSIATFARPREASPRIYSFGNSACRILEPSYHRNHLLRVHALMLLRFDSSIRCLQQVYCQKSRAMDASCFYWISVGDSRSRAWIRDVR